MVPLLEYQRVDVESSDRFRWNCWSRQTGKSFTKSLRRILRGLSRRRTQIFLSAGERQSRELMEKARQHCNALKIATDFYDGRYFAGMSVKQLEIVLPSGVRIIGLPANPQTARGFTGDVFLDEFAMHLHDREIWAAMFPTLLRGNGELDIASTPKGCGNVFYELRDNPRFTCQTVTLPDAISYGLDVDAQEIRKAMNDDLLYRQEFLCAFIDEATAFLSYEQIARCCDRNLKLAKSVDELADCGKALFVGVDIGRTRDLTVAWVLEVEGGECWRTRAVFELCAAPFSTQWNLIERLLKNRRVARCCIDAGGLGMQLAEQAVERFGQWRVEGVTFTPSVRSQLGTGLRLAVEAGRIRLPDDDRVKKDFHSLRRTLSETGHFRLNAPRVGGSHSDRFWAAALAVRAADAGASVGEVEMRAIAPIKFARRGAW